MMQTQRLEKSQENKISTFRRCRCSWLANKRRWKWFLEVRQGNNALTEEEKLDQEDQRIKIIDLGTLEELTEGNASVACGELASQNKASNLQLVQKSKTILDTRGKKGCRKVQRLLTPKSSGKDQQRFQGR